VGGMGEGVKAPPMGLLALIFYRDYSPLPSIPALTPLEI